MKDSIRGQAFVLGDNIDTDQIIPAEHLVLNPAIPEERRQFGKYALCGVPPEQAGLPRGQVPFVAEGAAKSDYKIAIGGRNFGCGSSREHAPLALGEAGIEVVVAQDYARIFFRNSVNGGYLAPYECEERLCEKIETGDDVEVRIAENQLVNHTRGESFALRPLGDILPILEAGDIFAYARKAGMLE
jgi:3-isopropylmalate/(R)-2-methylmalate dehydratase small subunit